MKNLLIKPNTTIRQSLKRLTQGGEKCLVVVSGNKILLGTLSDGDLRKTILNGSDMGDSIQSVYNPKPTILVDGKYEIDEAKKLFTQGRFDLIPVIDEQGALIDILVWGDIFNKGEKAPKEKINVPVVIMAGGKGTRMEPFTYVLPKPLIPIHEKSVIEHIIERFTAVGISDFYITINYKSRIIKAFFEELDPEYSITFVEEEKPLGTAGSLRALIGNIDSPFFLSNCDTIINTDLTGFFKHHVSGKYAITLAASAKEYVIPFGACKLDSKGGLHAIKEKPSFDFLINTGLYIINPEVLNLIPKDRIFHTTDLIHATKKKKMKIGVYPIDEDSWIDVGQWSEYQKAVEKL